MPVDLKPYGDKGILYYRFWGPITADDLQAAIQSEGALFAELPAEGSVTGILDMSELRTISPSLLAQLRSLRLLSDSRVCRVIVVGASPYLRALTLSLGGFGHNGHEFIFRSSLAEALQAMDS
ncbi:MAG: hypothetical protein Kow00106_18510 [Anaerolineae bacterium]